MSHLLKCVCYEPGNVCAGLNVVVHPCSACPNKLGRESADRFFEKICFSNLDTLSRPLSVFLSLTLTHLSTNKPQDANHYLPSLHTTYAGLLVSLLLLTMQKKNSGSESKQFACIGLPDKKKRLKNVVKTEGLALVQSLTPPEVIPPPSAEPSAIPAVFRALSAAISDGDPQTSNNADDHMEEAGPYTHVSSTVCNTAEEEPEAHCGVKEEEEKEEEHQEKDMVDEKKEEEEEMMDEVDAILLPCCRCVFSL